MNTRVDSKGTQSADVAQKLRHSATCGCRARGRRGDGTCVHDTREVYLTHLRDIRASRGFSNFDCHHIHHDAHFVTPAMEVNTRRTTSPLTTSGKREHV